MGRRATADTGTVAPATVDTAMADTVTVATDTEDMDTADTGTAGTTTVALGTAGTGMVAGMEGEFDNPLGKYVQGLLKPGQTPLAGLFPQLTSVKFCCGRAIFDDRASHFSE